MNAPTRPPLPGKTPTITLAEFARRRQRLMRGVGGDSIIVVPAAHEQVRNRDVEYPFRQNSDFLYLTGFPEPDAVAVLVPGRAAGEYILFCRDRDPTQETWQGRRAGPDGAMEQYGAECAFPIEDIDEILPGLMENRRVLCAPFGRDEALDQRLFGWVNQVRAKARNGVRAPHEYVAVEHYVHEQRLFKKAPELRMMRHAAAISCQAHIRAMQATRPGMTEFMVEAELLHEFHRHGTEPAYSSIVGGGENGCILHYIENRDVLNEGDLLLIDAGCEVHGYASDITRTFPVSGRFSDTQREVYECVLAAQHAAIEQTRPGNHWNDPHDAAVRELTRGLKDLGVLKGRLDKLLKDHAYRPFYMHRTGHWLGLDVHDVGDYRVGDAWRLLEPGMVTTVEPGLYFGPYSEAPKALRGIGIRIEDDVAVSRDGHEVLTGACPKTPADIEACMAGDLPGWT
ncbi:peptidase M24 [Thioalkalivibrio sp. K90mix]|uniref:Xaa-Pro aminopeptidase n=1 Tax=Thioalkalivibrio sp. (strain K90mix) TaxID=396595 RepID=UPI000195A48F|nr:Xaa-Pro aminopeptidase [Thioalkalivibrio sp. K90mix]ADC72312.1 peptidase M24 [Thioalkalivibrio sp. K90mix]